MHDDLESFSQNPSQKICKNLFDFEKPQIFQQIPKSRSECMKCMIKGLKRDHTCEICNDKTKEWVGRWKVWVRRVWEWERSLSIERDQREMR